MFKFLVLYLLLGAFVSESESNPVPLPSEKIEVANALRYLNQLDKMYSGQIRPRSHVYKIKRDADFGFITTALSQRARPRFGKRSFLNIERFKPMISPEEYFDILE